MAIPSMADMTRAMKQRHFKWKQNVQKEAPADFRHVAEETREIAEIMMISPIPPLGNVAHRPCNTNQFLYQFLCAISEQSATLFRRVHTQHVTLTSDRSGFQTWSNIYSTNQY